MAKKAAALQSFQKCEIQNLAIPATILEDVEVKEDCALDSRNINERETNAGNKDFKDELLLEDQHTDLKGLFVQVKSVGEGSHSQEPSDRIELAGSPVP